MKHQATGPRHTRSETVRRLIGGALGVALALWGAAGIPATATEKTTDTAAVEKTRETKMEEAYQAHRAALAEANAAIEQARPLAKRDPLRPIFHAQPAARWIGDPNGPVLFNGEYHLFFQHLPFAGKRQDNRVMWGHMSSPDLVHWTHQPIALAPNPGSYDAGGIASGCCVVHDGVPTIIYTGFAEKQVQCLATSSDTLRTWRKDPANPVIATPPPLAGLDDGLRDPYAWREGNEWRLLVGSGFKGRGGAVLLYRSTDLRHWEFLGPLCEVKDGMGARCFQWECPNFFPLGDRHVLIVSPLFHDEPGLRVAVQYAVGKYQDNRFTPGAWQPLDLGGPTAFYAPNSMFDARGRCILWGWLGAARPDEFVWHHCLTLPRVLTLAADGTLRYEPLPELATLRRNERVRENVALEPDKEVVVEPALGLHGEIMAEIEPGAAARVELRVGRTADGHGFSTLAYDAVAGRLTFGDKQADFKLAPGETTLRLRLFTDGMIGEAYINERACFSNVLPMTAGATGVSLMATGSVAATGGVAGTGTAARVRRLALWEMGSIWPEQK